MDSFSQSRELKKIIISRLTSKGIPMREAIKKAQENSPKLFFGKKYWDDYDKNKFNKIITEEYLYGNRN